MCFELVCQFTEATHCVHQGFLKCECQSTEVREVTGPERLRRMFQTPISKEEMYVSGVKMSIQKLHVSEWGCITEGVQFYGNPTNSLKNLRLLAICFTAYAGFLRYDELYKLKISDLKFYKDYVKIFIEKSKTLLGSHC